MGLSFYLLSSVGLLDFIDAKVLALNLKLGESHDYGTYKDFLTAEEKFENFKHIPNYQSVSIGQSLGDLIYFI
ncbi:hypothetical protein IFM89_030413 [Coptis chinensis]|uniref:Uncharacterized protein n=1 Tax=Coptis chinensis TaxID=261450 RepID=A0A835HY78_9MAGN|nr:hypothetical protein IFM89_030413 [Coptis chinensis]